MKKIESNKVLFVFLIICAVAFAVGIVFGAIDVSLSRFSYEELEYREYVFVSYNAVYNSEGGDQFFIRVEGQEKTLCIDGLLTPRRSDDFDALQAGDKIYCYVYKNGGRIQVAEIKADAMIISLEEHNNAHRNNGIGLVIIMSILSVACVVMAIVSTKRTRAKATDEKSSPAEQNPCENE